MQADTALKPGHRDHMREWERTAPIHRKVSGKLGLQGKLLICFMVVLSMTTGVTTYVCTRQTRDRLTDSTSEQARQIATALSLASQRAVKAGDWAELERMGEDLIKGRNILFVAYFNAQAQGKTLASRDLGAGLKEWKLDPATLTEPQRRSSREFGNFVQVVAPILGSVENVTEHGPNLRLLGYVAVGVSESREESQIAAMQYLVIGIGCLAVIVSLPIAYLMVWRIFLPIRKLVSVTRQITSGDLNARVEIHRPDVIGELARSFDEMVNWVKKQQEALADANDQLAEVNRGLESQVEQRTAQLAATNNRLCSEIAEKEDYLRAVSHDLNAPLRNISGIVSLLLNKHKDDFDPEVIYRLERVKSNVNVETDLIEELIELSRIKSRRRKMELVDATQLIGELKQTFEADLRGKNIVLKIETPLPNLFAEKSRVRQIFQNLIDNAIKYMGDGETREIRIGCESRAHESEFYVADTGIGIHPSDLEKVFLMFRRGRNSGERQIAGKGIGLASVKSIVENYAGRIWVTSVPQQGSTFRFTFNARFVSRPNQPMPTSQNVEISAIAA